jgi:hypothetical protein
VPIAEEKRVESLGCWVEDALRVPLVFSERRRRNGDYTSLVFC